MRREKEEKGQEDSVLLLPSCCCLKLKPESARMEMKLVILLSGCITARQHYKGPFTLLQRESVRPRRGGAGRFRATVLGSAWEIGEGVDKEGNAGEEERRGRVGNYVTISS
ncbi:hypothetical protein Droror1_Dr00007258 [Drosera rotundifolia]